MKEIYTVVLSKTLKEGEKGYITDPRFQSSNTRYCARVTFSKESAEDMEKNPDQPSGETGYTHFTTLHKVLE